MPRAELAERRASPETAAETRAAPSRATEASPSPLPRDARSIRLSGEAPRAFQLGAAEGEAEAPDAAPAVAAEEPHVAQPARRECVATLMRTATDPSRSARRVCYAMRPEIRIPTAGSLDGCSAELMSPGQSVREWK